MVIKSALEIALERTKEIEVDKEGLAARQIEEEGKRSVGKYLAGDIDAKELASQLTHKDDKNARRKNEGAFSVLAANLTLPQDEGYGPKLELLREGFAVITGEKRQVAHLFQQVEQFFGQYLQNQDKLIDAMEEQFGPRLREREQEMSRQYGSQVKLTPQQDPEFAKALKQQLGRLEAQYSEALQQAREQLKALFEAAK